MDNTFAYTAKTDKQLLNWFNQKVRAGDSGFINFEAFKQFTV